MNNVETSNTQKRWWMTSNSAFSNWENDHSLYTNLSDDEKQDYWNCFVFSMVWYDGRGTELPIDIAHIKQSYQSVETDLNRFLPWTIESLIEEWFDYNYSDVFVLDESAERYLRIHWLTTWNSQTVEWIVSQTEQQYIELAEKVGDLFYDALADVLDGISETTLPEISSNLKKASEHIQNAWEICKPYINEKTNPKHKTNVVGMDNKILWNRIGKLDTKTLKQFLVFLWEKIHKDWLADEWRWRKKLATELFESSSYIKQTNILI